jgi:hypothetical protein
MTVHIDMRREYLLAELRCAALRARLLQSDIEAVGLALNGNLITCDQAVEHLRNCGLFTLIDFQKSDDNP